MDFNVKCMVTEIYSRPIVFNQLRQGVAILQSLAELQTDAAREKTSRLVPLVALVATPANQIPNAGKYQTVCC